MTVTAPPLDRAQSQAGVHQWSPAEKGVLVRAACRSPYAEFATPWSVDFDGATAHVLQREHVRPVSHRDQMLACGAAGATLATAFRILGWHAYPELLPNALRPNIAVRLTASKRHRITRRDIALYAAIFHAVPTREPQDIAELPKSLTAELLACSVAGCTSVEVVSAGSREARRASVDSGLLVCTADDTTRDHLAAGFLMQILRLIAGSRGWATHLVTGRFSADKARRHRLHTDDVPQLVLQVGPSPADESGANGDIPSAAR
ncbi:hypothetical protein H0B56_15195 [Haloechinothrix sp. YIM 98757]|uniref:Nitroreductase family protein n=1 Tax=Haloechinothrix aidingensis TaxID=2752311 RepID=A0A838ACI2_9PSEU|nr:hypothetical protein [Haloechinothrix aidingensis]MBA0126895.1 hypothetical protein [Haloechinothrix aidingensis]